MADNQKAQPEGLDEFLADQDPQAAIGAQGFGAIGHGVAQALSDGPKPNNFQDPNLQEPGLERPLVDPIDLIVGGAAGKLGAKVAEGAGSILGNELGSVGTDVGGGALGRIQQKLGASSSSAGFNDKIQAAQQFLKQTQAGFEQGLVDHTDVAFALQNLRKAERLTNRNKFAQGGEVQEPQGLNEFLNNSESQPSIANQASNQTQEPHGLNEFLSEELQQDKYGTPIEQGKAALEGLGQGLFGPLAPLAETKLGVDPEAIRGRQEANPITHYGSEIAGLVGPALVTGPLAGLAKFTQSGALSAIGKLAPKVANSTLASTIGINGAKTALDNMLLQGSDEVSKMILKDPAQSTETAMSNIGLAGALGGLLGSTTGAIGNLWKAQNGSKASKLIEDFKGRLNEHVNNPDPVNSVTTELSDYYTKVSSLHDDVYGPNGLKAQDIQKALPEMNNKIASHTQSIYDETKSALTKMMEKPNLYPPRLASKLNSDLDIFSQALSKENLTSADVFNATQDLKQTLQGYSKFDKFVKPVDEAYDFVRDSKKLAANLRQSLENKEIWGKAAHRQQAINSAFSDYLPALKDFEKKFTSDVAGERQIDPGKINTYMNQVGKPNAEIKQANLRNFLEASEKYKKVINDTHNNLGIQSPVQDAPMNVTLRTLDEKTTGERLADAFIDKGLKAGGAHGLGAAAGASLGGLLGGHVGAGVGAIIGHHALAPFFNSVLPAIAKSVLEKSTSIEGLKAATDYGIEVVKGESLLNKATKAIFKAGSEVIPQPLATKDTHKLDKMLLKIQSNPELLMNKASDVNHYMPDHGQNIDMTVAQASMYLNSLRPNTDRVAPLDGKPVTNPAAKAAYQNALNIAQEPTLVLDKVRNGTITSNDIQILGNMYPNLYNRMKEKITNEMVEHSKKGEMIPYKTRIGISMFLAQPLDSTMNPSSILAAQSANAKTQEQSQQPQTSKGGTKSSPALQKMPNMYQTGSQARNQRAQKN